MTMKKLVHLAALAAAFLLFALPGSPGAEMAPTVGGEVAAQLGNPNEDYDCNSHDGYCLMPDGTYVEGSEWALREWEFGLRGGYISQSRDPGGSSSDSSSDDGGDDYKWWQDGDIGSSLHDCKFDIKAVEIIFCNDGDGDGDVEPAVCVKGEIANAAGWFGVNCPDDPQ